MLYQNNRRLVSHLHFKALSDWRVPNRTKFVPACSNTPYSKSFDFVENFNITIIYPLRAKECLPNIFYFNVASFFVFLIRYKFNYIVILSCCFSVYKRSVTNHSKNKCEITLLDSNSYTMVSDLHFRVRFNWWAPRRRKLALDCSDKP